MTGVSVSYSCCAVLWQAYSTISSWRPSHGCVWRACSSTSCSLRCSRPRSLESSTSTSLDMVSATVANEAATALGLEIINIMV